MCLAWYGAVGEDLTNFTSERIPLQLPGAGETTSIYLGTFSQVLLLLRYRLYPQKEGTYVPSSEQRCYR